MFELAELRGINLRNCIFFVLNFSHPIVMPVWILFLLLSGLGGLLLPVRLRLLEVRLSFILHHTVI